MHFGKVPTHLGSDYKTNSGELNREIIIQSDCRNYFGYTRSPFQGMQKRVGGVLRTPRAIRRYMGDETKTRGETRWKDNLRTMLG